MNEDKPQARRASVIIEDLKYNPETQTGPLSSGRAFTFCELVVYRFRDIRFTPEDSEYAVLTELAEEIEQLRQSWQRKEHK